MSKVFIFTCDGRRFYSDNTYSVGKANSSVGWTWKWVAGDDKREQGVYLVGMVRPVVSATERYKKYVNELILQEP